MGRFTYAIVASFLPKFYGFSSQQDRRICLWHEKEDQRPLDAGPDQEHPEGPSPVRVLVDETADDRPDFRPNELHSQSTIQDEFMMLNTHW